MKRDRRLHGMSSQHHDALELSWRLAQQRSAWTAADGQRLGATFETELEPHFRIEEELLLPALLRAGVTELVARVEAVSLRAPKPKER